MAGLLLAGAAGLAGSRAATSEEAPWPSPVPGYKAPEPGEHPRILFRKSDLPRLKKVAQTPEGQAILKRIRICLNGSDGETMCTKFGVKGKVSGDGSGEFAKDPPGTFTISHMAGYGFLYQLTGNKKYADLGKECWEKAAVEGYRDRDRRYSFRAPYGALRAGPSIGWMALGYDLCYDGWDPAFRKSVAEAFNNYNEGQHEQIDRLARGLRQHPGSNHWGMQVGGAAMAILAIMNDPGVDMGKIGPLLDDNAKCMVRNMTQGFGDGGFFAEGDGTGSMSSHIAFLTGLQAWKIAGGKDFITPRPNAQWLALRWVFQSIPKAGTAPPSWFWPHRGGYPHNIWARHDKSGGGYFGIGFAGVTDEQKPGMLWVYNHAGLRDIDDKAGTPFDTPSPYPHHSICAFVNWPWEMKEKNPSECLPHNVRDSKWGFYGFRNHWQDPNDIVITVLTHSAKGNMGAPAEKAFSVMAFGKRFTWGSVPGEPKDWQPAADGSAILNWDSQSVAIDFSKASGADGMLVTTGAGEGTKVDAGGKSLTFKFLTGGSEPAPKAEGDKVVVGQQAVSVKDGKIVLGKMAPPSGKR
jgi:hypothetical protein